MAVTTYPTKSFKLKRTSQAGVLGVVYDLDLGEDGGPQMIEDNAEQAQAIELRLQMILGEAWEDAGCGLPWHDWMGMKPPNLSLIRYTIITQLYRDARVTQIKSLDITYDPEIRKIHVEAYIKTKDGSTVQVTL